jgi:nucleotide-binding universal stress UspA family protein
VKKIVVGFDASDPARDALLLGADLAASLDASLVVASAIEFGPLEIDIADYNRARAEHYERVFEQARDQLGGAGFERRELQDTAAHGLTELAEAEGADLIVLGSTHRGPIGRVLGGSVASALFHGAPCAVVVAPRGWATEPHAGLGLIGVGFDGSDESATALAQAIVLARARAAKLRVIAIAPYLGSDARPEAAEASNEVWTERLDRAVEAIPADVEYETVLREGREATELALQAVDLDLLVVGSRGYGPLRRTIVGSVSGELARTAPCPVLVVPRGASGPGPGTEPSAA